MVRCAGFLALLLSANGMAFATDLSGIWMGQAPGRNAEKQDVAFQFKNADGVLSGVMFGDEFDVPLEDIKVEGGKVTFSVTTTNYYSGSRLTMTYTGTILGRELQLTRQRKDAPGKDAPTNAAADDKQNGRQSLSVTRVTP